MAPQSIAFVLNLLLIAGGLLTMYSLYFCIIALVGLKKCKAFPTARPKARFAVVIAARNEESVIGPLLDSLHHQNYPKEMYDVYVAPNNCNDNTRSVAMAHGAEIFDPIGPIKGKGEVLAQMAAMLVQSGQYDAMCVFDADNVVHPNFLQGMQNAYAAGVQVGQGFRDSKNPADTAVSTCYSICYWMLNRFYNAGRQALHLSGLVNGSGFMVSMSLLQKLGGWNTATMTEDYEFTAQCVLAGEKVHYVPEAVIYDEQPLTFSQSWKQRRRWSTGSVQGMEIYLIELIKKAFAKRSWICMDLAFTYMTPVVQFLSFVIGLVSAMLTAYRVLEWRWMPMTQALWLVVGMAAGAFLVCAAMAAFVIRLNQRKSIRGTGRGIIYFALFLLSWLPISLISLFVRKKTWEPIKHTRTMRINDIVEKE